MENARKSEIKDIGLLQAKHIIALKRRDILRQSLYQLVKEMFNLALEQCTYIVRGNMKEFYDIL